MLKNTTNRMMLGVLVTLVLFAVVSTGVLRIEAAAGPALDVKGLTLTTSGNATWTASDSDGSNKSVNGTVSGTDKDGCTAASAKYGTLTFKNELASGKAAYLTFDYTITANNGSVKIGSDTLTGTGTGSRSVLIEHTKTVDLVITSGAGSKLTTAIELTNIALTEAEFIDVTFQTTEKGSYTVNGEVITGDTVKEAEPPVEYSLAVTEVREGYTFFGWYSTTLDGYFSRSTEANIKLKDSTTIYPVFLSESEEIVLYFKVGDCYFTRLESANTVAVNGTDKQITLIHDYTLPAGEYTISSGVTFLIPYDEANTLCTTTPTVTETKTLPSVYRTLTMASGANITIANGGAISVSAQQYATSNQVTSVINGGCGQIKMQADSNITVQRGGNLYAWGWISRYESENEGSVTIESGGNVYEMFQVTGYRGGNITNSEYDNNKGVFILNQYYVQNVEVPMTLEAGASEKCVFSVSAAVAGMQTTTFDFFGSSTGMFRISSGSVTKDYIESSDRLQCTANNGTALTLSNIVIKISVYIVNITMNSSNYVLPIQNNVDVVIGSNCAVTIDQDMALLPGASLTIGTGSTVNMDDNALYVYDKDGWGNYAYIGQTHYCIPYVSSGSQSWNKRTLADAQMNVDGTFTGKLYSVGGPANIHGTGTITQTADASVTTYQYAQGATTTTYPAITANPAVLQNATTHTAETSFQSSTNTYTFDSVHGAWITQGEAADATCTTAGHTVKKCNKCGYYETISATGHEWNYETGECDGTCGAWMITLESLNLNIAEQVELIFNFTVHEEFRQNLHVYVNEEFNVITEGKDNPLGKDNVWDRTVTVDADGTLSISQGIAAGEMTGNVNVQFKIGDQVIFIYDKSSGRAAASVNKTVKDCLMAGITNNTKEAELYKAAALFGGYAQLFYGITTDRTDLVNYGLLNGTDILALTSEDVAAYSAALNAYKIISNDVNIGITATSQKVNLDAGVYLRVYFTLDDIESYESYDVTITFPSGRGTGSDTTGTFKLIREGNRCYVDIKYIPVAYWNDNYTINVTKDSQTYTVTTSVLAWARSCFYLSDNKYQRGMALAMYKFCTEADAYFTEKTPEQGGNT